MRWSSAKLVKGLSGTSLALAMGAVGVVAATGCSTGPVAEREDTLEPVVKQDLDEVSWHASAAERERGRDVRRSHIEQPLAEVGGPAPWFLRPVGDTNPVSTQRRVEPGPAITSPPPSPPPPQANIVKPAVKQPIKQQPARPKDWGIRAACGRG